MLACITYKCMSCMIGKEEGTGHVKGDGAAVVTVAHAGNEAAVEKGGTMIEETEMTKVNVACLHIVAQFFTFNVRSPRS